MRALAVLGVLIVGLVGAVIGRSTATGHAAAGVPPLKVSQATLNLPHGPSKFANGLPVGFTDDQGGALSAAAVAGESLIDLVQSRRATPVPVWLQTYTTGQPSAAMLQKIYDWNPDRTGTDARYRPTGFPPNGIEAQGNAHAVLLPVPIGFQMLAFSAAAAHLKLWINAEGWIQGVTVAQPSLVRYDAFDVQLTWAGGDWKITSLTQPTGIRWGGPAPGDPGSAGFIPWPGGQFTFVTG